MSALTPNNSWRTTTAGAGNFAGRAMSPAKAVENLRLEAARFLLEQGRFPIETIAFDTGFGDRERMRRSFLRAYGQSPQSIRKAADSLVAI
jgi:transcriptional regulator GlxA family with amidase domain